LEKFKNKNLRASSKNWISRQSSDPYARLAKKEGYRSRSAFKLIDINKKFNFLKNNLNIIDLGSSPGGWSQVISKVNKNGKNLSVDILQMEKINNISFFKKDFNDSDFLKFADDFFNNSKVDLVLSDMAVNTTGNRDLDAFKTNSLALEVVSLSKNVLKNKSFLLLKFFTGRDDDLLIKGVKDFFEKIIRIKPDSSRKDSREMYLLCKNLKTV
jgi:23S rRNA (uridine2552-2'-O)-methyltransferase